MAKVMPEYQRWTCDTRIVCILQSGRERSALPCCEPTVGHRVSHQSAKLIKEQVTRGLLTFIADFYADATPQLMRAQETKECKRRLSSAQPISSEAIRPKKETPST